MPRTILQSFSRNARRLRRFQKASKAIGLLEARLQDLSDEDILQESYRFQEEIRNYAVLDPGHRNFAFALVREAARRCLGQRHYDVQLIGGMALDEGMIAEMRTGEGKTLVAALATYLNAAQGKGVHVVTVNDYLARRDAETIGQVHRFLGLTVGVVTSDLDDRARRAAYACDVTYTTNTELGFDYLRDNLRFDVSQMVQRGLHYAIVDEVDSILIDEARTPLIISAETVSHQDMFIKVDAIVRNDLQAGHYVVDEQLKTVVLTEEGQARSEVALQAAGLLRAEASLFGPEGFGLMHQLSAAVKAHKLFERDRDYIVKDGEVLIIDQGTGRIMKGRRYSDGIHQAIEAKESCQVQPESQTMTSITLQNLFRMYRKLSGMTGTASTEAEELATIYGLEILTVPTHRPIARNDEPDEIHLTKEAKLQAIVSAVSQAHDKGQPVLIGTSSVSSSEAMADMLRQNGFKEGNDGPRQFQLLNARNHEREADIIAEAGRPGAITIATNMAGRGTDIRLGGQDDADGSARRRVIEAGGLMVIGSERHDNRRIDNQLRGRSGRQGDPGRSRFYVSLEDDLVRVFGSDKIARLVDRLGIEPGEAISHPMLSTLLDMAQKKVERLHYESRKDILQYDSIINQQRSAVHEFRREIMASEDCSETIDGMIERAVEKCVLSYVPENSYPEMWDLTGLQTALITLTGQRLPVVEWGQSDGVTEDDLIDRVIAAVFNRRDQVRQAMPKGIYEHARKTVFLQSFDLLWRDHLANLEELKKAVGMRTYAQREPLIEFRTDAYAMFERLMENLVQDVASTTARIIPTAPIKAAA